MYLIFVQNIHHSFVISILIFMWIIVHNAQIRHEYGRDIEFDMIGYNIYWRTSAS